MAGLTQDDVLRIIRNARLAYSEMNSSHSFTHDNRMELVREIVRADAQGRSRG